MRVLYHFRNAFFLCLLTFLPKISTVFAQTAPVYGHEWINYTQPYYKIQVVRNGLHRITYNELAAAGINSVNPEKFQIFRRGKQLAVYVNGQNDQTLNAGDYIEFYGERNDGKLDVTNYKDPAWQTTFYYSLYTDTASYFLTWGTANGKRMVEKTSQPAGLSPEPRSYAEAFRPRIGGYSNGFQRSPTDPSLNSWGDKGEGYVGPAFVNSKRDTVSNLNPVETTGRQPVLQVRIMSAFVLTPSKLQVKLRPPSGPERLLTNATSGASGIFNVPILTFIDPKFNIQNSDIYPDGSVRIRVVINDSTVANNFARISYIKLQYAQTTDLLNKERIIFTDSTKTNQSYFLFSNPPANSVAYDITDPYNVIRTEGVVSGAQKGFVFDPSTNPRKILIGNAQAATTPATFKTVQFTPVTLTNNYDYIIITHKLLHKPVTGTAYNDPPAAYAAYRTTAAGGGFNPLVIDMDQVYDQYHYGEKSPYAITNFMNRMIDYWVTTPDSLHNKHLLLLGKGVENSFVSNTISYRKDPLNPVFANRGYGLVPTAGVPPSDVLFTSEWKQNKYFPRVSTGRVPVISSEEVVNYLEKVKAHELQGLEDWRKNFLHLGGGDSDVEIAQFRGYLKRYEDKASGPILGARVKSLIRSNNGNPVFSLNVKDELNAGLSFITFFGHSSANVSDLDIGFVSDPSNGYNNLNKYPMILMNGCVAGNSFQLKNTASNRYSFGEDWVNTGKKGALMFLADAHLAFPNALDNFSDNFYKAAFTNPKFYGKPVGEIMQQTIKEATKIAPLPNSLSHIDYANVLNQMILQGDPAVRLFAPAKPDYKFAQNGLLIRSNPAGSAVTANSEKFDLVINLMNTGKAITDSVSVSVKRTLPTGDTIRYKTFKVRPIYSDLTYTFTIDNKSVSSFGSNTFEVTVDYGNKIDELLESNNKSTITQYFSANGVLALLPVEYSIVNKQKVKLIGQPANLLTGPRDYYFEIDTVNTFKSGFKMSTVVTNVTSKPTWTVNLLPNVAPKDSVVYYWRFRFNTFTAQEDTIWAQSSFRYIPNSPTGWSQSHYAQFDKDNKDGVNINPVSKKWEFAPTFREFKLKTVGGNVTFSFPGIYGIQVDNSTAYDQSCISGGDRFLVTVYNNKDLSPYIDYPRNKCGSTAIQLFYNFPVSSPALIDTLARFLQKVPNGYYVAMVSVNNVPFSTFTQAQKDAFKLIGSQLITTLQTGYPFAILGQKGPVTGTLVEEKSFDPTNSTPAASQEATFTRIVQGFTDNGTITSTRIGPATSWTTLHHTVKLSGADDYELNVFGYDANGQRSANPLLTNVTNKAQSLAAIDAVKYPFIQLEMYKADLSDRSAPQLKQWMVVYQGVPEGMVRPDLVGLEKYNIQKQAEKGQVKLRYAFSNISELPFGDSLTVVRNVFGNKPIQDTIKVAKLLAGDSVFFDFNFSTGGMKGYNVVKVDVNPRILPEQYYFNNFLEVAFTMPNADLHPVLDVAFDGVHIMDGDIVSPSPKIAINLKDEDKFDYVSDPDKLELFLLRPGALTYEKINLKDAGLVTLPNLSEPGRDKRDFNIIYNPKNLPDGIYKLRVQGSDNSNHEAGFEPYTISFEVVNESAITHFYPYPNPFTSNTRFVFTVTGNPDNMPRNLKIQIMTLTGKVVREIQKEELGIIKVGNNMSAPWDGTDEFGDKLANGTYLYRVVIEKAPLEEMKLRRTAGDKSFKKEYGKLYILR
jgi:hypothetical protein